MLQLQELTAPTVTMNFDLWCVRFCPKMHQCSKSGENTSSSFQETVLTMFHIYAQTESMCAQSTGCGIKNLVLLRLSKSIPKPRFYAPLWTVLTMEQL